VALRRRNLLRPPTGLRRLNSETIDPLPTSNAAMTRPPVPVPVVGKLGVVLVDCCTGARVARSGTTTTATDADADATADAADATHAWCWTPLSSVTTVSTPSTHDVGSQGASDATVVSGAPTGEPVAQEAGALRGLAASAAPLNPRRLTEATQAAAISFESFT
jgi:hypothetical protein